MKTLTFLSTLLSTSLAVFAADNLVQNGDFENGSGSWDLQCMGNAKASVKVIQEAGKHAAAVEVTEPGEKRYFVQLVQRNLHLDGDKSYELTFRAKAKTPADVVVTVSAKEGSGFREMWRQENIALKEEWDEFRFTVTPKDPTDNVYLILSGMAKQPDEYFFTDVTLTEKN